LYASSLVKTTIYFFRPKNEQQFYITLAARVCSCMLRASDIKSLTGFCPTCHCVRCQCRISLDSWDTARCGVLASHL